jgi:hypothetical protein
MEDAARCGRLCGSSYRLHVHDRVVGDFGRWGRRWWWCCRDSGACGGHARSRTHALAELLASWCAVDSTTERRLGALQVSRRRYYRTP